MQRQYFLTGCHQLYSLLPFSRIFLPNKSGPYVPEPHVQRERGRKSVRGGFSSVCGVPPVKLMSKVLTLYMKSLIK